MDGLNNYREKIKSIEELVDKMESGELSIHELIDLESLTRDLHERSIILKYKAFESKVEGANAESEETQTESPVVDEEVIDLVEEVIEESEAEEESALDFSMFDSSEADSKEEIIEEIQVQEEVVEKPEPMVESAPEPVMEEKPVIEHEETPEPVAEEEPMVVVKEKGTSFLDRLSIADNSISSQLAGRKLDTLSGAFGINQRLLYINELFDGSGEAFSDAIKTLDTQPDLDEASSKVEEMAFKNSWNPEEEVVLEFLSMIKRRYA